MKANLHNKIVEIIDSISERSKVTAVLSAINDAGVISFKQYRVLWDSAYDAHIMRDSEVIDTFLCFLLAMTEEEIAELADSCSASMAIA